MISPYRGLFTLLVMAVAVIGMFITGCGGQADQAAPKTQAPAASPKPTAPAVPVLAKGQSLDTYLSTSNGAAKVRFTLTGLKFEAVRPDASKPKTVDVLCIGLRVENTGTLAWESGDLPAVPVFTWFGTDGEQAEPDPGWADSCPELGEEWAGLNHPAPQPGKWVKGYYSFIVPGKTGELLVTDGADSKLFRLQVRK